MNKLTAAALMLCLGLALCFPASAADYTFSGTDSFHFGDPTSVEPVATAGGGAVPNVDVSKNAALIPPGFGTPASYLPGSGWPFTPDLAPGYQANAGTVVDGSPVEIAPPPVSGAAQSGPGTDQAASGAAAAEPVGTPVTAVMYYADGSIGTVRIPALGLTIPVWEGESAASMAKGLGHYSSTSGWDGNVGLCGHNRGSKYVIGSIKDLKQGDLITYTTAYGVRTYQVTLVKIIANTDWSYLQPTADNRITLTTCLANSPNVRVCVQAAEVV